jgi:DNA-binding Lrp family transcriptional regulator
LTQRTRSADDWLASLLTLRECARSFPAAFGRALDIPRATALYRIRKLEEDGLVTGYIPMTIPTVFGTPYLVRVNISPKQYQFHEELQSKINSLVDFFETGVGHAPLSIYVYHDQEQDVWQVNCIAMTSDIKRLTGALYHEQNIARESVLTSLLS